MRIAIDAHSVGTELGGNESYATNLIEALAEIDSANEYTLYVTRPEALTHFDNRWPNFTIRATLPHTPLIRIPLVLSAELRRNPVDVLHVQFTAPLVAPCPVVATIHDLSFEHLPRTFKRRSSMQLRLTVRHTAKRAAHILTLSEYSKRDLMQTYGIASERITVTPAAAPPSFAPVTDEKELARVRDLYGITGDYILAVGSIQPRKNLSRLIAAYSSLHRAQPGGKLPTIVLAGKCAWLYDETLRTIRDLELTDSVILTGYVPAADLPALYSAALCFVYPSYFEGFGLPPLEAMQCGTPVIVGDKTSLPEVVGDAAVMVDPFSIEAIARAIELVIGDSNLRSQLRAKGLQRAKLFDWRDTAQKTLAVYQDAGNLKSRKQSSNVNR
ncbi:MAG TPA: glycosyltransferase family 1 protein [Pyrinomonadaceae bacterium]|nr:glycosyltransferase family 1 protein [Pyrinomonadaceae bacterium]